MEAETIVFWTAGSLSVIGALMTITRKHPVASVMWLVMTFIALAALFLFVVMLLNLEVDVGPLKLGGPVLKITAIATGVALFVGIALVIGATDFYQVVPQRLVPKNGQVIDIAKLLFTKYLLPFEVTSALLLAAIVGAGVVTRKGRES